MDNKIMILALMVVTLAVAGCAAPADIAKADVQAPDGETVAAEGEWRAIDPAKSTFAFEGYAPGKSHVGTFTFYEGDILIREGMVVGARGSIDASSVKSDGERLENHLRSDDFFDVESFPSITFTNGVIEDEVMTGDLTFIGVTNKVSFPVETEGSGVSAEFILDTTPYGMKYVGVNKDVRIAFTMTT